MMWMCSRVCLLEAAKTLFGGWLSLKCTDEFVVYSLTVTGLFVCAVVYSLLCYFGTREQYCWLARLRLGRPPGPGNWIWLLLSQFAALFFFSTLPELCSNSKYFTYFFFAQISQSLEILLILACRFLESSEAEISQCSHHVMPDMW